MMFSGIIEKVADVVEIRPAGQSLEFCIATGMKDIVLGESIAVNGVCLTATSTEADQTRFFVSPETLNRSNLGALVIGSKVNLERSVALETRLSGHMVQGHVDGKGTVAEIVPDNHAYRLTFDIQAALGRYCVEKGSICLNGTSLTINAVDKTDSKICKIAITLIPHTWDHTNFSTLAVGDAVNVEVDVIAKYVESLCLPYLKP
jgi:riboflavin synthase